MIFCNNNKTPSTPNSQAGNSANYPFSNVTTDTLQNRYFFTSFVLTVDSDGAALTATKHPKLVLFGLETTDDLVVTIDDGAGGIVHTITEEDISADGYAVVDIVSTTIADISIGPASGTASISHMYLGKPYTLPDPDWGVLPQYADNDVISEGQNGKQFVTEGHAWRQETISVTAASKTNYDLFVSFFTGSNRRKPFVFMLSEGDLDLYAPFFARLDGSPQFGGIDQGKSYNWEFIIREVF